MADFEIRERKGDPNLPPALSKQALVAGLAVGSVVAAGAVAWLFNKRSEQALGDRTRRRLAPRTAVDARAGRR